jgi:hypothetical protein
MDIAAAALKLAQAARGDDQGQEQDIPAVETSRGRGGRDRRSSRREGWSDSATMPDRIRAATAARPPRPKPATASPHGYAPTTRLELDIGRKNGITAKSIVNTLIDEVGLKSRSISNIAIEEQTSMVDVPTDRHKDVIRILRRTGLAGKKTGVRVHQPEGVE